MSGYAGIVMIINFFVELLLLLGTDRLYRHPTGWWGTMLGAGVASLYAGACLLPRFCFITGVIWRLIIYMIAAWLAFGTDISALRKGAVFVLMNLALEGITSGFNRENLLLLAVGALVTTFLCTIGFQNNRSTDYVPVEIKHGGKSLQMTALRDTGNTLLDPLTGRSVLIVGADAAYQLTGLTRQQLRTPVETMGAAGVPGLRLIPYHTIGQATGFLLAMRMQETMIGDKKGSCLVAFAPEGLNGEGAYQALTGGVI